MASIEQRPIMEIGWPAQIEDPRAALAFLRANAAEYHLDPQRFGACQRPALAHGGYRRADSPAASS